MRRVLNLAIVFVCVTIAAACTDTVKTFSSDKIGTSANIPLEQVTAGMLRAAQKTQWQANVIQPGLIEAKREWGGGKHNIVVDIAYTSNSYEIKYKSSKNLSYTGTTVHRSYNLLLDDLNKAIKAETWNL